MIEPKTIELMNRVLDGAATEPERADLDRILVSSAEARTHFDALSKLVQRLDGVPMVEPPVGFHDHVVSAIEASGHRYAPSDDHGFIWWIRNTFTRPTLRYVSTFGLGLATGAVVLAVVRTGQPVDPGHVSGTMSTPAKTATLPVAVPEAGVSGAVAVTERGSATEVRLEVDGGTEWVFEVPSRDNPAQSVVLKVVKSGETVFEGAVPPVEP